MTVYERIENLRKAEGISQGKLEKELGFSNGSISKWKTSMPTTDRLQKIADRYNVSLEYLMTGEEKEGAETYYLNDETREIAQEIFENPDLRSLFDMSRKMPPERLKAHIEFIEKLYKQEKGEDY